MPKKRRKVLCQRKAKTYTIEKTVDEKADIFDLVTKTAKLNMVTFTEKTAVQSIKSSLR